MDTEPKVWIDYTYCREMTDEEVEEMERTFCPDLEEMERWNTEYLDDEGYVNSLLAGEEV